MGLIEKALEYKKAMNRRGEITLIDKIQGPAETEMMNEDFSLTLPGQEKESADAPADDNTGWRPDIDLSGSLFDLPEDDNNSPLEALEEQRSNAKNNFNDSWVERARSLKSEDSGLPDDIVLVGPLTSEDDPVLPKDIDAEINSKKNNELFAENGEPDIVALKNGYNPSGENNELDEFIMSEESNTGKPEDFHDEQHEPGSTEKNEIEVKARAVENLTFQEHMTLFEISKEIAKSETKKVLFEVVVFSVMGQTGTSFASILIKNPENDQWIIAHSSGLKSGDRTYSFSAASGIFKILKKDIIDIDQYMDEPDYQKYYQELNAIGIKLLVPWFYKGRILGILALGKKITDGDYSSDEFKFIEAVCESSAVELNKINTIEKLKTESENSTTGLNFLQKVYDIQEKIQTKDNSGIVKDIVREEFEAIGILKYAVFLFDIMKDKYISVISSGSDLVPSIDENNQFISFIKNKKDGARIVDFNIMEIVREAFDEARIKKMSLLWIYPLIFGRHLMGFIAVFDVEDELLNESKKIETDGKLDKLSKMILSGLLNLKHIDPDENKYTDNIEIIYKRINSVLSNSKIMNIPFSMMIFSIKNYKRYGNLFGYEKAKELIADFTELMKSRLSDTDFCARYDRNKIIVVLPGKDKKFAMLFANTVRNEFMHGFKNTEMQLLITFLISGYPDDGDDLLTLLDIID
jgi:GGDEF domain-containing protein